MQSTKHRRGHGITLAGFTLIELMIVVIIIGILAAVAYPSYQTHVTRTRRVDAQIALTEIANRQEKFLLQCNQYSDDLTASMGVGCDTAGLGYTVLSPDGHYRLEVALTASGTQYTAVADPNGVGTTGSLKDNGRLRIDHIGNKRWDKNNDATWCCNWTDQ